MFEADKLKVLLLLLKSKGILNEYEMDWFKNLNTFNEKVIIPKLEGSDPDFYKIMGQITYKEFEDYCRSIATKEESLRQQREAEEGI